MSRGSLKKQRKSQSVAFISERNSLNNLHFKEMTKLIDNINIRIISELVKSPDTSSPALANNLRIPLSSLQRRRARLEKFLLNKAYHVNLKALGGKMGDVIINVEKGKSREVALDVLKKYKNNIMNVSTRINTEHNISAQLLYKDTAELHSLLESIKSIPFVTALQWSEIVEIIGDNSSSVISAFFDQQEKLIVQDTSSSKR